MEVWEKIFLRLLLEYYDKKFLAISFHSGNIEWYNYFLDLHDTPERLRKATLHVDTFNKCFSEREFADIEICATSTMAEGKACKVGGFKKIF